jgi:adenine deaminase
MEKKGKAELIIRGGNIVNVYTEEILEGYSVAVANGKILHVGKDFEAYLDDATTVISTESKVVVPGFIDAHTHMDYLAPLTEYIKYLLPRGTTTIVTELAAIGNCAGYEALFHLVSTFAHLPGRVFGLAPVAIPPDPRFENGRHLQLDLIKALLDKEEILGIGEAYWPRVLSDDLFLKDIFDAALVKKKVIEGHSAGARGKKLWAYAAAGVTACHESITPEEALERLRLGLYVMVRGGSNRNDMGLLKELIKKQANLRRLILVTDGMTPKDLVAGKGMASVVQEAINLGLNPLKAFQAVSLNAAERFGLDHWLGGLAPGHAADILILPSLTKVQPECVICRGRIVAKDGEMLIEAPNLEFPKELYPPVSMSGKRYSKEDFQLTNPGGAKRVRVISLSTDLLTSEKQIDIDELGYKDGNVLAQPAKDILKVALISRYVHDRKVLGLLHGFGLRRGACATSVTWDTGNLLVMGSNEEDMASAINRLLDLGGGLVFSQKGRVLAELSLPLGGLLCNRSMKEVAEGIGRVENVLRENGCSRENPFLSLQTLTFTPLPSLRITDKGIVDVRSREIKSVFVE